MADWLKSLNAMLRAWAARNRKPVLAAASILFLGLVIWAVTQADLTLTSLDWRFLALNAFILTPATLILNGAGISAVAHALSVRVSLKLGVSTAAAGVVAELTPAPGGLLARATVLLAAGAPPVRMAQILTACAGLFIAMAMALAAATLSSRGGYGVAPLVLGGIGLGGVLIGLTLLMNSCAFPGALLLVAHRTASLILALLRIWCAFAAIGAPIVLGDAPLFVAAAIIGALVFVVPAGLGVAELIAAGAAPLAGVSPAAAIAATALNRVLALGFSAVIVSAALETVSRKPD